MPALSICFRFVNDEGNVPERFYELTRIKEPTLRQSYRKGFYRQVNNSSSTVLALGADGASVLSGCYEGVAAKLKRMYP